MITKFLNAMITRSRVRQTLYELDRLTDRELRDIGIHRGEIGFIAAKQ